VIVVELKPKDLVVILEGGDIGYIGVVLSIRRQYNSSVVLVDLLDHSYSGTYYHINALKK
jgi:hypothetical protein